MKLSGSFFTALDGLKTNRGRSALTILGIIIGIAAVIAVMSVGQGAQSLVLGQIQTLGSNLIIIIPGGSVEEERQLPMSMGILTIKTLTRDDAKALSEKSNAPFIEEIMPIVIGQAMVIYGGEEKNTNFIGATANLPIVNGIYPQEGRFFTEDEEKGMVRVAVLGSKVKEKLFGESEAVGQYIKVNRRSFEVIGVMEEKGARGMEDLDNQIYIPLSTAQKQILGINYLNAMMVNVASEDLIDQTISDTKTTLRIRHNISDPSKDDFTVRSQKEFAEIIGAVTGIFTILLACVAAISLVVGGIGIMNIMLVSVTERTREIGLRKAVGAGKNDILIQFLLEAVLLTFTGGIFGIALGALLSWGVSLIFGYFLKASWGFLLPLNAIALGVGVSVMIGLIFGIYPARKAAQLSPIEALRYE